jgi:2-oxoglutarate ferredoxin oxidoreductase subunit gamma
MTENILIAGSGGQGVLTLGIFLAKLGIHENKNVVWIPSYGAEKRGGFSFCRVVISDHEIYSPFVEKPDTLILFDQRAVETYRDMISDDTLVIENSSLIEKDLISAKNKISLPASTIARELSFIKAMNLVIAGGYLAYKLLFKIESVYNVISELLKNKSMTIIDKNIQAFEEGLSFIKTKVMPLQS